MPRDEISHPLTVWVPVHQLLLHNQFLKYGLAAWRNVTISIRPPIPIFVSHRWQSLRNPDPEGLQHHVTVRFLLEAICFSRQLCERYYTVGSYPVVRDSLRDELARDWIAEGSVGSAWQQACGDPNLELLLRSWL